MSRVDRIADYLETGQTEGLGPEEVARLEGARAMLADDASWEEPPLDLEDDIRANLSRGRGLRDLGWVWGAVAALILVIVAIPFFGSDGDSGRSVVATIAMSGTEIAPDASGTAGLVPTPNGWAIELDVRGLAPAEQGTFYQGWVSDGDIGVSVGTFHMRGDQPTPIALWSGVDLHEYNTLNITIQDVDGGPASSGRVVLTGMATEFD